jgi:hypothetical protein
VVGLQKFRRGCRDGQNAAQGAGTSNPCYRPAQKLIHGHHGALPYDDLPAKWRKFGAERPPLPRRWNATGRPLGSSEVLDAHLDKAPAPGSYGGAGAAIIHVLGCNNPSQFVQ